LAGIGLVPEAVLADALDLTVETIRKYTRENKIPSIQLPNGEHRYHLDAVIYALTGELPFYRKSPNKTYTYQDYLELPDEPGYKFEIIDGRLVRLPSATVSHQRVLGKLVRILDGYFRNIDPQGLLLTAPLDVTFQDNCVVKPDILYVSSQQREIIQEDRLDGAPNLIVEITSPASRNTDSFKKYQLYLKNGVQHYWLVDPDAQSLHCFSLRNDKYTIAVMGKEEDVLEHPDFAGLIIGLGQLWLTK